MVAELPAWLSHEHRVTFRFGMAVSQVEPPHVVAGGITWQADRVWICSGHDFETLYPLELAASGMVRCKLQMMRSKPQNPWRLGPMLAAGLTLRHYKAFESCATLAALWAQLLARVRGSICMGFMSWFHKTRPANWLWAILTSMVMPSSRSISLRSTS